MSNLTVFYGLLVVHKVVGIFRRKKESFAVLRLEYPGISFWPSCSWRYLGLFRVETGYVTHFVRCCVGGSLLCVLLGPGREDRGCRDFFSL